MEKTVTFGKLLTVIIIIGIPLFFYALSIEDRFKNTKDDYDSLNKNVLKSIESISISLKNIEYRLTEKDSLNNDNASER